MDSRLGNSKILNKMLKNRNLQIDLTPYHTLEGNALYKEERSMQEGYKREVLDNFLPNIDKYLHFFDFVIALIIDIINSAVSELNEYFSSKLSNTIMS